MRAVGITLVTTALAAAAMPCRAGVLGTWDISTDSALAGIHSSVEFQIFHGDDAFVSGTKLFDVTFSSTDAGATVTATSANNANFNPAVAFLTNGVDGFASDLASLGPGDGGAGSAEPESRAFTGRVPAQPGAPDFAGYTIDTIQLKLNSLVFTPTLVNGQAGTEEMGSLTETIFGTSNVPEPGAILLITVFAPAIGTRRPRRS